MCHFHRWSRQHNIGFSVCHDLPDCIVSGKIFHAAVVSLVDEFLSLLDAAVFTLAFSVFQVHCLLLKKYRLLPQVRETAFPG